MPIEKPTTVKFDADTRKEVLSALGGIKKTLEESNKSEKPETVSDKIATKLAEGKGIFSSLKESLVERGKEKTESFKKMLDPVNIIKSMTGDSKLAGVLTAKALGRSEEEIRKEAGLEPTTPDSPEDITENPKEIGGVNDLLKTLNVIAVRVDQIANSMGATPKVTSEGRLYEKTEKGAKFLTKDDANQETAILNTLLDIKKSQEESVSLEKEIVDAETSQDKILKENAKLAEEANDAAREAAREAGKKAGGKSPSLMKGKNKEDQKDEKDQPEDQSGFGGMLSSVLGIIGGAKTIGGTFKKGIGAAKSIGGSILKNVGLKKIGKIGKIGAIGAGIAGAAAMPWTKIAETKVAADGAKAVAKTAGTKVVAEGAEAAAKTATKEGLKSKIAKIIAKKVPKALLGAVGKSVPLLGAAIGLGMAVGRLVKGDWVGAGLEAVSGLGSAATAIPATVASLARDVYTEAYEIEPEKDPSAGQRMPELTQMVQSAATDFLQNKGESAPEPSSPEPSSPEPSSPEPSAPEPSAPKPSSPTGEPTYPTSTSPTTDINAYEPVKQTDGAKIDPEPIKRTDGTKMDSVSRENERSKEEKKSNANVVNAPITNINNKGATNNNIITGMPSSRTTESSWIASRNKNYVPI